MKVIANRDELLAAVKAVGAVVKARTPKPVLACIRLEAKTDSMTLYATDLETAVKWTVSQVQPEMAGETCANAADLLQAIQGSQDSTVTLELDKNKLHIRDNSGVVSLVTLNPKDYPPVPEPPTAVAFTLPAKTLFRAIRITNIAVADSATRFALNGILLEVVKRNLNIVATEGHKLSLVGVGKVEAKDFACVLANPTTILRTLPDDAEDVKISIDGNRVLFSTECVSLTLLTLEGVFPPYADIIPREADRVATVGREMLLAALSRASLMARRDGESRPEPMRFEFWKGGLRLISQGENGESEIRVPCKYEGSDLTIGFNGKFIREALAVADCDDVRWELIAPNRPCLMKLGDGFEFVVSPVNINN